MTFSARVIHYYHLTKPGIVRGNTLAAIAGFLFASGYHQVFSLGTFFGMTTGTLLVIASGCVFNNYIDRKIDRKMERTKKRVLVTRKISHRSALVYASILLLASTVSFLTLTNYLTCLIALFGFLTYVILYGVSKRKGTYGTLVGAIAGAIPPVIGYTAVSHRVDIAAIILFATMFIWQLPHFYAIAMFRVKDYQAANIPVLPNVRGALVTRYTIISSIIVFIFTSSLLTLTGYTGYIYLVAITSLGVYWLYSSVRSFKKDDISWAKYVFKRSLIVLLVWSLLLSLTGIFKV